MATSAEPTPVQPGRAPGGVPTDLTGELEVLGRVTDSSNLAVLARLVENPDVHVIYKPVRGERPLWDFPDGTLAGREVAARVVSDLGGWGLVPPTILRDGPLGPGSVQQWIGDPFSPLDDDEVVDLVPAGRAPEGWLEVLDGETPTGAAVTVVHSGADDVRSLAVLDAVLNNSDRKGSHCLRDENGRLWAIDHGVSFSPTPKLRTVLWGWAGQPLPEAELERLRGLASRLADAATRDLLRDLLPEADVVALVSRVDRLLADRRHPRPSRDWPSVPWPPL
ncbi:phosphatidylinositol kinase [Intrasporangium oryzae NRRL B-24470]|uniref:Phosphatidylinositol kinase n=1 Tax=Intrasporangium oryzae NRRL B-24470 TaxID=1386089 RepID=W9GD29_9MICO|nr:SCO1664 family protein [Intrasporangium oryzae]EWT01769.1 phosphatidylinositol kinase [Intrasporangium oryzae NRRL B-24470]